MKVTLHPPSDAAKKAAQIYYRGIVVDYLKNQGKPVPQTKELA